MGNLSVKTVPTTLRGTPFISNVLENDAKLSPLSTLVSALELNTGVNIVYRDRQPGNGRIEVLYTDVAINYIEGRELTNGRRRYLIVGCGKSSLTGQVGYKIFRFDRIVSVTLAPRATRVGTAPAYLANDYRNLINGAKTALSGQIIPGLESLPRPAPSMPKTGFAAWSDDVRQGKTPEQNLAFKPRYRPTYTKPAKSVVKQPVLQAPKTARKQILPPRSFADWNQMVNDKLEADLDNAPRREKLREVRRLEALKQQQKMLDETRLREKLRIEKQRQKDLEKQRKIDEWNTKYLLLLRALSKDDPKKSIIAAKGISPGMNYFLIREVDDTYYLSAGKNFMELFRCTASGDLALTRDQVCDEWYSLDEHGIRTPDELCAILIWEKDSSNWQLFDLEKETVVKRETLIRNFAFPNREFPRATQW